MVVCTYGHTLRDSNGVMRTQELTWGALELILGYRETYHRKSPPYGDII